MKSEYAFVHSSCFGVQPDADRRPERQSAGACCVSGLYAGIVHRRFWFGDPQWDSFLLWKSLCLHKLLKKATFVLLLNKYDLLDAKLRSGIQFRQFVTSYKDRPNRTETVLQCESDFFFTSRRACCKLTRFTHRFKGEILCHLPARPRKHAQLACACHLCYRLEFDIDCAC